METPFIHLAESPLKNSSFINVGQYNGYVNLPFGHKWYGIDYDEIPVEIHGGLTYSAQLGEYWSIGFDTAHFGDTSEKWDFEAVYIEAVNLLKQCL